MKITLKYFGMIAERTGKNEEVLSMSPLNSDEIRQWVETTYSGVGDIGYVIALDRELIHDAVALKKDCEIAFLPPFAGG